MAQLVKCLVHRQEESSSDQQHPWKIQVQEMHLGSHSVWEEEGVEMGGA